MSDANPSLSGPPDDPVFLHARREALMILALWASALAWVVPYCYFFGYHDVPDPDQLKTVWGVPDWVFWGVFVPWIVCTLVTIVLCVWFIQDDDLDSDEAATSPG